MSLARVVGSKPALPTVMSDTETLARMNEIRDLLNEFGLHLGGFDPGVMAWTKQEEDSFGHMVGDTLQFERAEWKWLEPILRELRNYRRSDKRKRGCKKVK